MRRRALNERRQAFVPELELAAGIGFDGHVAIDEVTGKIGAFSTGKADAIGCAFSQRTLLAHLAFEPLLAMAALASHFCRGKPTAFSRIFCRQPDLVRLILLLSGLVNGALLTIQPTKGPMSHCASFHKTNGSCLIRSMNHASQVAREWI